MVKEPRHSENAFSAKKRHVYILACFDSRIFFHRVRCPTAATSDDVMLRTRYAYSW